MSNLKTQEQQLVQLVTERIRRTFRDAEASDAPPEMLTDVAAIADAMTAVLPRAHAYDQVIGPFYDSSTLSRWLGISRQALHKRVKALTVIAASTADGILAFPAWQFTDEATPVPGLLEVWQILRAYADPWTCALWMCAPAEELDGATAVQWLTEGRSVEPVVAQACADAERWAH